MADGGFFKSLFRNVSKKSKHKTKSSRKALRSYPEESGQTSIGTPERRESDSDDTIGSTEKVVKFVDNYYQEDFAWEDLDIIEESNSELKETEYLRAVKRRERNTIHVPNPNLVTHDDEVHHERRTLASVLHTSKKTPSTKADFSRTIYQRRDASESSVASSDDFSYPSVKRMLYAESYYDHIHGEKRTMLQQITASDKLKMADQLPGVRLLFPRDESKKTDINKLTVAELLEMAETRKLNLDDEGVTILRSRFLKMAKLDKRQFYKCAENYRIPEEIKDWQKMGEALIEKGVFETATKRNTLDTQLNLAQDLNPKVALWKGDISRLEVDAVVNSASSVLLELRTGVSYAICNDAGPILDYELRKIWHTYVGEIVDTAGYCLPAKYVFHTSGPPSYWQDWEKALRNCYKNALDRMKELQLKTLAFCCIATGAKGVDYRISARIALQTTHDWLVDNHESVDKIVFCIYEDFQMEIYKDLMPEIFPVVQSASNRVNLPPEILRMDGRSIELYMKALDEGKTDVHNIRVMVVGHFDVGKTTLTKRLLGEDVNIDERNSTDGIDVHVKRCRVSLESGEWEVKAKGLHKDDSTARLAMVIQQQVSVQSATDFSSLDTNPDTRLHEISSLEMSEDEIVNENPNLIASPSLHDETDASIYESDNDVSFKSEGSVRLSLDQSSATTPVMEDLKLLVQKGNSKELQDINKYANLSIWDFAGQYAFYGTHQIFLSRRAVYLLVIDLSKHMDSLVQDDACMDAEGIKMMKISEFVEFWLKSIHFYTKEEKTVILVGTHADKLKKEGREDEAQILFDELRDHLSGKSFSYCLSEHEFVIDNSVVDTKLDDLKKAIFEVAKSKTDYWGESIPAKWLTLERILVTRKNDKIIERQELEQVNQELCVPLDESGELDLFLRFQHECGLILYFSEESLRDYIVLDPQWLIDAFKCFITTEMFMKKDMKLRPLWKKFNENGVLTQEFIDQSWNQGEDKQFYKHKNHLLGLMEKLDIISRPISFTDQERKLQKQSHMISESDYFTPCMLKEQPPENLLDPTKIHHSTSTSKLCYTFESQFIPPAIFHRLLAASMAKWEPRKKKEKVLLYCGCGIFDLNSSRSHQLTIYYRENYVQIWLTRYSAKQCNNEQLDRSMCLDVRDQVEKFLHKVCDSMGCSRNDIRTFIKCPRAHFDDSKGMIELATLEEYFGKEYCCSMHEKEHVLESSDICACWSRHEAASLKVLQAQYLDRLLTEIDVATMSPRIGLEWQQIGRNLGLSNSEIEHCVMDNLNTVNRISAMLNKWRKQSSNPTLRELKSAIQSTDGDVVKIFEGFERMEEV